MKACFRCHQRRWSTSVRGRKTGTAHGQDGPADVAICQATGKHDQIVRWKLRREADMDDGPAMGGDAAMVGSAGITLHVGSQRPAHACHHHRHDAARPDRCIPRTTGRTLRHRVGEWNPVFRIENDAENAQAQSKSPEGVMKELAIYCLVYNMVRAVTAAAGLGRKWNRNGSVSSTRCVGCCWPSPGRRFRICRQQSSQSS